MTQSHTLFEKALHTIPGGVNSPVRAFRGVGGEPIFIRSGKGAMLIDADGREYIDYVGSWGPLILGHAHPAVLAAVINAAEHGFSFGAPTEWEVKCAEKICALMPAIERIRMVNSGTEATMTAIRLARGFTGRNQLIKFEGCYHGHSDSLLVKAGSGALTLGQPSSLGVPESVAKHTWVAEYNRLESVEALFQRYGDDIAAVIVEPIAGNMNCILPRPEFLPGLRDLCDRYGSVLIFDEVMTGFRVALGGATELLGVTPDLMTLGKIIGGGFPVGALGGRAEIMNYLAPVGPVYQAGTLSGNPVAMAAGLATLECISEPHFYESLSAKTNDLCQGLREKARAASIPLNTTAIGGMFGIFFTDQAVIETLDAVQRCHVDQFKAFFHGMLASGVYFAPSAYEAGFVSSAHQAADIQKTLQCAEQVFHDLSKTFRV